MHALQNQDDIKALAAAVHQKKCRKGQESELITFEDLEKRLDKNSLRETCKKVYFVGHSRFHKSKTDTSLGGLRLQERYIGDFKLDRVASVVTSAYTKLKTSKFVFYCCESGVRKRDNGELFSSH